MWAVDAFSSERAKFFCGIECTESFIGSECAELCFCIGCDALLFGLLLNAVERFLTVRGAGGDSAVDTEAFVSIFSVAVDVGAPLFFANDNALFFVFFVDPAVDAFVSFCFNAAEGGAIGGNGAA